LAKPVAVWLLEPMAMGRRSAFGWSNWLFWLRWRRNQKLLVDRLSGQPGELGEAVESPPSVQRDKFDIQFKIQSLLKLLAESASNHGCREEEASASQCDVWSCAH
jgi:hypothetical protein